MLSIFHKHRGNLKNDVLSGLTVALALVPEAIAFAFVAGVDPLVGLYAAFLVGLITSVLGGRPGMISGATGALAVVMVALVKDHGIDYLFATVVLMGCIQALAGFLKLGKFIRMIPHPVMLGFVNGLAIVIFRAQFGQFTEVPTDPNSAWLPLSELSVMVGFILLTMGIMYFLPKITQAIPSGLAAIVTVTCVVYFGGIDTTIVKDLASVAGGLPTLHLPVVPLNFETIRIIFPYAIILAAIGLIESLMTLTLIDELTETRGKGNRECVGHGVANIVTGFFGGMGGCAMIGQSMININSGGRGRASGFSAALFLLCFILFASGLIEIIPMAALTGVMFMVVIGTFEWSSFRIIGKIPRSDAFVLVLVSIVTVMTDLAMAVFAGVIVSALVFAWEKAKHISARRYVDDENITHYELDGPLFFAAIHDFHTIFQVQEDTDEIIIDFMNAHVHDHSSIEAINALTERYRKIGKKLHLKHLSKDCRLLLNNADEILDINVIEDPYYHVADDTLGGV
jgi:SulP family sulfate permease